MPEMKDYLDLLASDDDNDNDNGDGKGRRVHLECTSDLSEDFILDAMGVTHGDADADGSGAADTDSRRVQLASFEPYGARFAKWTDMDRHNDKFAEQSQAQSQSQGVSLYDQTI